MTIGTADRDGVPWVSPVWYAPDGDAEFLWVSDPAARHSRNLAARPRTSLVIFDSHAPVGTGRAVYAAGIGEPVPDADLDRCVASFSRRSEAQRAAAWTRADVVAPARVRLYRATASACFLGERDVRRPVRLGPRGPS